MNRYAIILAGGLGRRMRTNVPKQFLHIHGKPIIVHSIEKFVEFDQSIRLIVVVPPNSEETWKKIKNSYLPNQKLLVTKGGKTRAESVRAGLAPILENGFVAIHDAARPFVSIQTITQSFKSAEKFGSGIASIGLKDSIRKLEKNGSYSRDRSNYVLVQTPQTFRLNEIKKAYQLIDSNDFFDDASVYEAAGHLVKLVPGSFENTKITTFEDLPE